MKTIKEILYFAHGILTAFIYYLFFVADNLICIFLPWTKLPFKDFARNLYARKMAYRRIVTIIVLYFIYWLIF